MEITGLGALARPDDLRPDWRWVLMLVPALVHVSAVVAALWLTRARRVDSSDIVRSFPRR